MSGVIDRCPDCGADNLETFLRLDLDRVTISAETNEVIDFVPAASANDPATGVVVEVATVTCRECGFELDAGVPASVARRWTYREPR